MKKIISVFLSVLMLAMSCLPAYAESKNDFAPYESTDADSLANINFWDISDYNRMSLSASQACAMLANSYGRTDLLWLTVLQLIQSDGEKLGITELLSKLNLCTGFDDKQIDAVTDTFLQNYLNIYVTESGSTGVFSKVGDFLIKINGKLSQVKNWDVLPVNDLVSCYVECSVNDAYVREIIEQLLSDSKLISKAESTGTSIVELASSITNTIICNKMLMESLMELVDENSLLHYGLKRRYERDFIDELKDYISGICASKVVSMLNDVLLSDGVALSLKTAVSVIKVAIKTTNTPVAEDVIRAQYSLSMSMNLRSSLSNDPGEDDFELLFKAYHASMITTYNYFQKIRDKSEASDTTFAFDVYSGWLNKYGETSYDNYVSQRSSFKNGNTRPATDVSYDFSNNSVTVYPDGFKVEGHQKITYFSNYIFSGRQNVVFAPTASGNNYFWSDISFCGSYDDREIRVYYQDDIIIHNIKKLNGAYVYFAGNSNGTSDGRITINGDLNIAGHIIVLPDANVKIDGSIIGSYVNSLYRERSYIVNQGRLEFQSLSELVALDQDTNPDAELIVNGNFEIPWYNMPSPYLVRIKTGTAKLKGNVAALLAEKNAKIIFCGNTAQEVDHIESYDAELTNPNGFKITSAYDLKGSFSGNGHTINGTLTMYPYAYVSPDTYCTSFRLYQNSDYSYKYEINRNLTLNGKVYSICIVIPEGKELVINGDCKTSEIYNYGRYEQNGTLNSRLDNSGTSIINGNFEKGPIDNSGTLDINGDVNAKYMITLSGGTMSVSGNLTSSSNLSNISCSGEDTTLVLDGNSKQFVQTNSSVDYTTVFNILEIKNSSSGGVIFNGYYKVAKLFDHHRNKFTFDKVGKFVDYDGDGILDNVDPYPTVKSNITLDVPEGLNAEYGDLLSSVELPEGWSWKNGDERVELGDNLYTAMFRIGDDVFDYSGVPGYDSESRCVLVDVNVSGVSKKIVPSVWVADDSVFNGKEQIPDFKVTYGDVTLTADDYVFDFHNNVNAGINSAYISVSAVKGGKYAFDTVNEYFSIQKAEFSPETSVQDSFKWGESGEHTVKITGLPKDNGGITAAAAHVGSDEDDLIDDAVSVSGDVLTYCVNNLIADKSEKTAVIEVTIDTLNYKPVTFSVVLTANEKDSQESPDCELALILDGDSYTAVISSVSGAEYSFNGGAWSDNNTLSGIAHVTKVTASIRMKETAALNASVPVTDIQTTGHTLLKHYGYIAPDCVSDGCLEHWRCDVCGLDYSDEDGLTIMPETVIAALGHVWSETYQSDRDYHWKTCEICGTLSDKEWHHSSGEATENDPEICSVCRYIITPAKGHVHAGHLTRIDAKSAACTENGNNQYYRCDCGKLFTDEAATAETTVEEVTIKAAGHKYGDWEITVPPTTNSAGVKTRKCVVCGDEEQDTIPALSGGSSSKPYSPSSRPSGSSATEEIKPAIDGREKGWTDIAADIKGMPYQGHATISMNGNTTIPASVIRAIIDNKAKVELVADSVKTWLINGAEISDKVSAELSADLSILTGNADKSTLRGITGADMRINNTAIPAELKLNFRKEFAGQYANLYKVNDGKPVFQDCFAVDSDGSAVVNGVSTGGEYVVMVCEFSDLYGDANNDGTLNALDASSILKMCTGIERISNPLMGDVNGDGSVNALDASLILKMSIST